MFLTCGLNPSGQKHGAKKRCLNSMLCMDETFQCRTLKNKAERVNLTSALRPGKSAHTSLFPFWTSRLETRELHEAVEETHQTTQLCADTNNWLFLSSFIFFKRMCLSFRQLFPRTPPRQSGATRSHVNRIFYCF